jgi:copper(I)-binding protein
VSRSQHHKAVRLRLTPAALGFGAVIALAGCSAGQVTQTDTQVAAVNGASGTVRDVGVRDAQFTFPIAQPFYPAGSSVPLQTVLVNGSGQPDRLLQVTSPYAASGVQISGITDLPSRTALRAYGTPPTNSRQPTTPGQPPTSPAPGSVAPSAPGSPSGQREVTITLNGLTQKIGPGVTVPVTFVFEKAGAVTVQVPIGADPKPRPEHGSPGEGH